MARHPVKLLISVAAAAVVLLVVAVATRGTSRRTGPPEDWTNGLPPGPVISAARAADFVGSDACRECHAAEFRDHAASWHAHTLAPVMSSRFRSAFSRSRTLYDPVADCTYVTGQRDGSPFIRTQVKPTGEATEMTPAYAVGGGEVGTTFVYALPDGRYMESRISYYTRRHRFWYTAGQPDVLPFQSPVGRIMMDGEDQSCFGCHSTTVVVQDGVVHPERSVLNVGCERCHGAGKRHVEAARARSSAGKSPGFIHTYGHADGRTITRLCSGCHRGPGAIEPALLSRSPELPRFAGTAFALSRCFTGSQGRLSCVTCHSPHQKLSRDVRAYERVCLSCHTRGARPGSVCPVNARAGCISCHMPARHVDFPDSPPFHLHWIKPYRPAPSRVTARPAVRTKRRATG